MQSFIPDGHFCHLFVYLFEWKPSWRRESGYPTIEDFDSHLGLALIVIPPSRSTIGIKQTFLLPYARSNPNTAAAENQTW